MLMVNFCNIIYFQRLSLLNSIRSFLSCLVCPRKQSKCQFSQRIFEISGLHNRTYLQQDKQIFHRLLMYTLLSTRDDSLTGVVDGCVVKLVLWFRCKEIHYEYATQRKGCYFFKSINPSSFFPEMEKVQVPWVPL
jgi:hypothetical protein